jgi:hypothetical protein
LIAAPAPRCAGAAVGAALLTPEAAEAGAAEARERGREVATQTEPALEEVLAPPAAVAAPVAAPAPAAAAEGRPGGVFKWISKRLGGAAAPAPPAPAAAARPSEGAIGYTWSYLACRIGH